MRFAVSLAIMLVASACYESKVIFDPPIECAPGSAGSTAPDAGACARCEAGTYCAGASAAPLACTGDAWDHDHDPATPCVDRTTCHPGQRVERQGDATHDRTCAVCEDGTFSTTTNASPCTDPMRVAAACVDANDGTTHVVFAGATDGSNGDHTGPGEGDAFVEWTEATGSGGRELPHWDFGTDAADVASDLVLDGHGSVVVVGSTSGAFPGAVHAGDNDAFVASYALDGTPRWVRQLGTSQWDAATSVGVDASGDVWVAGRTYGSFDHPTSAPSDWDAFVARFDSDGTQRWLRQFGSTSVERNVRVAVAANGESILAGETLGSFMGRPSSGKADLFVTKLDAEGRVLWSNQVDSTVFEHLVDVAVAQNGQVVLASYGIDEDKVPDGDPIYPLLFSFDAAGTTLWDANPTIDDWYGLGTLRVAADGSSTLAEGFECHRPNQRTLARVSATGAVLP